MNRLKNKPEFHPKIAIGAANPTASTETPRIEKFHPPIIPPSAIAMSSIFPNGFACFLARLIIIADLTSTKNLTGPVFEP